MGKQTIFRGASANDGSGDNLRLGAQKVNENFTELYTALGDDTAPPSAVSSPETGGDVPRHYLAYSRALYIYII